MGVIEEGTVSGCIPSNEAFAVHYPAYPSSMARAIETLGGTQALRKVLPTRWFFLQFSIDFLCGLYYGCDNNYLPY